jgi:hypothetical protein
VNTTIIDGGRHRIIIGEHTDRVYISAGVDSASIGGFFSADQCMEAAAALIAAARHIRKRAP